MKRHDREQQDCPGNVPVPAAIDDTSLPATAPPLLRESEVGLDATETAVVDLAATGAETIRLRDQLQRLHAEFDNYRKRSLREREEWWRRAQAEVMVRLLPVIDDYRRSLDHAARRGDAPDVEGMLLVLKRLGDALAQCGLAEMEVRPGTVFDPERHEAVLACPSIEVSDGHVMEVFEAGWVFGGQTLRPCKVKVSSGSPEE